ncbi:TetR/AcrR family transcriptional regulator [Salinimonas sp. HHU 13199]|uniref:TetR/AcrR family transcriptional regulator n=1 Tax=Salinimonas profundi TaxID=2729140 RepID=A0ABR8LH77_9ALTE|nr:TetR/AcrR family transcriptional regulator [Salinimonas profundi]MBD3584563.1 TetR/AcrR family transcriptional regulator [Salinimonas profundi]
MTKPTKIQILDVAEALFAEQGFDQTSMRAITSGASVNLASVNYHYGSKKNLIQSVFKRYFDILMPRIDETLDSLPLSTGRQGIVELLEALVPPMLCLNDVRPNGTATFVMLLGKGYNETQGHLRRFIMGHYGHSVTKLLTEIHRRLPDIQNDELFWRLHFAMGAFVFSMSSSSALTQIAHSDFNQDVDVVGVIDHLIPFVATGIAGQ